CASRTTSPGPTRPSNSVRPNARPVSRRVQALPQAAFLLLLEAAVGGTIALFWIHARGEVNRGFTLFTGTCFLVCGGLAIWLRSAFPPLVAPEVDPTTVLC